MEDDQFANLQLTCCRTGINSRYGMSHTRRFPIPTPIRKSTHISTIHTLAYLPNQCCTTGIIFSPLMAILKILQWTTAIMLIWVAAEGSICKYPGPFRQGNSSTMGTHVFQDPAFWDHFQNEVRSKSWKCNFSPEILFKNFENDATLYKDDTIFRKRRHGVLPWLKNDTQWVTLILGACKEIANGQLGIHSLQLQNLNMLEALDDFVEHLNCFYTIAQIMASKGRLVKPLSQDSSQVHDIDKLDPIMLVGYSERFEDNQETSVWNACVDRHTHVNPHHQAHCLWTNSCCNESTCTYCEDLTEKGLLEMVCDKVSRSLQKNFNGTISKGMWDVNLVYFKGLPQNWLDKALDIIEDMKYD